mmetsp:Transcript_15900/g.24511  ORF Transcript_15900/g.24511 Transcript_15900/m.24511 type:complete len:220 (+) Transcript_15900:49-708(+)
MQTIQTKIVDTLETVKDSFEKRDEQVANRAKYFAPEAAAEEPNEVIESRLKLVSLELLDIGLFYGQKGVEQVKSLPVYQKVDSALNLEDKFAFVKKHGEEFYTYLDSKFSPIVQNVFFLYDKATNSVISFVRVLTEKQQSVKDYVSKTYSTVQVTVQGNWMRLDFDDDGSVSVDDLKKSMVGLYEFLKNFDLVERTSQIKSKLYQDAITFMQQELEEDR